MKCEQCHADGDTIPVGGEWLCETCEANAVRAALEVESMMAAWDVEYAADMGEGE